MFYFFEDFILECKRNLSQNNTGTRQTSCSSSAKKLKPLRKCRFLNEGEKYIIGQGVMGVYGCDREGGGVEEC